MFWKVLFSYCLEIKIYKKINWIFCFENKKIHSKIISYIWIFIYLSQFFSTKHVFISFNKCQEFIS
jgi:hypothetical protein